MPLSEVILFLPLPQLKFLHDVDHEEINKSSYENFRIDGLSISTNSFVKVKDKTRQMLMLKHGLLEHGVFSSKISA